jgi:hypothetical protein
VQKKRSWQLSIVPCSQIAPSQCSASGMRQYEVMNVYYSQQRRLILKLPSSVIPSPCFFLSLCRCASCSPCALVVLSFGKYQDLRQCMRGLAQNQYRIWRGSKNELIIRPSFSFLPFSSSSSSFFFFLISASALIVLYFCGRGACVDVVVGARGGKIA